MLPPGTVGQIPKTKQTKTLNLADVAVDLGELVLAGGVACHREFTRVAGVTEVCQIVGDGAPTFSGGEQTTGAKPLKQNKYSSTLHCNFFSDLICLTVRRQPHKYRCI